MEEEYCWTITQTAVLSSSGGSRSSVVKFECQQDYLVCAYIVDQRFTTFRLALNNLICVRPSGMKLLRNFGSVCDGQMDIKSATLLNFCGCVRIVSRKAT